MSPPLIPGAVSKGTIFAFTYMCIHSLYHIHPSTALPPAEPVLPSCYPILEKKCIKDKMRHMTFC
jgi:hypothetical protein